MSIFVLDLLGNVLSEDKVSFLEKEKHSALLHSHYLLDNYQKSSYRMGTACSKTRAEVSGGGAKPYKQKGTGNARRGSNRTPLRRGGGVIFGPKPRSYKTKLNKRAIKLGTQSVLSEKADLISVLRFSDTDQFKTRVFADFLKKKGLVDRKKVVFVLDINHDLNIELAVRNIKNVKIAFQHSLPVSVILDADAIYFSELAWNQVKERVIS